MKGRGLLVPCLSSVEDQLALDKLVEEIKQHLDNKTISRLNNPKKLGKFKGFTTGGEEKNTSN